jgi:trigger factor
MTSIKVECVEEGMCQRHLDIEVPEETLTEAFNRVTAQFSRKLKLPGFRKGKIPKELIRNRFRSEILNEVVHELVPRALETAMNERKLVPVDEPQVGRIEAELGNPLRFRASFEIMPQIEAKNYKGLEARARKTEVGESEIEGRLEASRERAARFDPIEDRGVRDGDFVLGSIQEHPIGEGRPHKQEGALIEVGTNSYHPTLHEKLQDTKPGDTVDFRATFPANHPDSRRAGKTFDITVEVTEIKQKVLPELDDELAKDLGEFGSLAELREHVRQQAEKDARRADERYLRSQLFKKLLEANPVEAPQALVEQELNRRVEELARSFVERGLDPQGSGIDWRDMREKQRDSASDAVRVTILLDRIAELEDRRETEDEVNREIERAALGAKKSAEVVRAQLMKEDAMEPLRRRLRREKAFDLVRQNARIQEG